MSASAQYEFKETLLKMEGVSKALGGAPVLRDFNLEIKNVVRPGMTQGQVVSILGPSGMGKTTLFRILAGLMHPDAGTVRVGPDLHPVKRGTVGVVTQNYLLFPNRTVQGNLEIAGKQAGFSGAEAKEKAQSIMQRFGVLDQAGKYPCQLSGGQRQRVAIAQQFLCSDHFMLMDEPFSGLDILAKSKVCGFLTEVAATDEQNTFILVTHDILAAIEVSDTILVIGRDWDEHGVPIPGAKLRKSFNLIELGLAWQHDIRHLPGYQELFYEICALFPKL